MKILPLLLLGSSLLLTPAVMLQSQAVADSLEIAAIRHVVSNETEMYYRQDFEGWKRNFVDAAYFRQYGYWEGYPDKVRYFNGFDTLRKVKELQFLEDRTYWKGSYEVRYNENLRVYKDVAWYTFEQKSYERGTNRFLGTSVELRILEKLEGQWKIAYLGYHYLPDSTTGTTQQPAGD